MQGGIGVNWFFSCFFVLGLALMLVILPKLARKASNEEPEDKVYFFKSLASIVLFASSSLFLVTYFPMLSPILIGAIFVFLIGLVSKAYEIPKSLKLLLLSGVGLYLVKQGVCIHFISSPAGGYYYLSSLAVPLTILWFVVVSNSLTIMDEIGGVSLGISLMASLVFGVVAYLQDQELWDAIALSMFVLVFCLGLILINGYSRLGDELSGMVGFLLASVAIIGVLKRTALLTLFVPILVLGVPLINMSYAVVSGYVHPLSANLYRKGSNLYSYLASFGLGEGEISSLIHLLSAYFAIGAILIFRFPRVYLAIVVLLGAFLLAKGYIRVMAGAYRSLEEYGMRRRIFGIRVDNISLDYALGRVEAFLRDGDSHIIVTPDSPAILTALEDGEYREVLEKADIVVPDGIGVVIASRLLGQPIRSRLPGIELMNAMLNRASFYGRKVFLLGAEKGVAEKAAQNMKEAFPGLKIVGVYHGYFDELEERRVIQSIRETRPDYLFVAMGVPKQEKWMFRNKDVLGVPIMMGVGGSFDVWAGNVKRAPVFLRRLGLEWLYRALREPWRFKKIIRLYKFLLLILVNLWKGSEKI